MWQTIQLVETLIELSDSSFYAEVRGVFDHPIKIIPDVLILTIASAKSQNGCGCFLLEDLYNTILPVFLTQSASQLNFFNELWKLNSDIVVKGVAEIFIKDPIRLNLSLILDLAQNINGSLQAFLDSKSIQFAVLFGLFAVKREAIELEKWIIDQLSL